MELTREEKLEFVREWTRNRLDKGERILSSFASLSDDDLHCLFLAMADADNEIAMEPGAYEKPLR